MADRTPTDGELLTDYATQHSDDAFAELLNRHGRLVLNICWRVLRNKQDAEDATQAVFLVLAGKANSLRSYNSVAGWLHRVAWNVAQNARNTQATRKRHEQEAGAMTTSDATTQREWQDLAPVLDEELNALPAKTRDAILLFHLEGRSLEETAQALDCPVGTLGARLSRGRDLLRERLARRGMILSTGLIVLLLDKNASAAELSADFTRTTLKAAHALASGQTGWVSLVSPQTHTLTQGALSMFGKTRLRILAVAVAVAALFLITLGNYSFKAGAAENTKVAVTPPVPHPKAPEDPNVPADPGAPVVKAVAWQEPANITESNQRFSLDLYKKLAAGEKDNFFVSPFSIQTALGMVYTGARGDTATEMAHTLHLATDRTKLNSDFAALIKALNTPARTRDNLPAYQLDTANALWCQKDTAFKQDFLDVNQKTYGAGANFLDFAQSEAAADSINKWVAQKTQGKIQKLFKASDFNSETKFVVSNAVYFKSAWATNFKKHETKDKPFTLLNGTKLEVPMMYQENRFEYGENATHQLVKLPYVTGELSMIILLPRKADGIQLVEGALTQAGLESDIVGMSPETVRVSLPKFKIEYAAKLNDVLQSMGMKQAFADGCDFSGITGSEKLFLHAVLHKTFVDVQEESTEAAVVSAGQGKGIGVPPPPKIFNADHPFLFLIRHEPTKSILFMGRVANPKG